MWGIDAIGGCLLDVLPVAGGSPVDTWVVATPTPTPPPTTGVASERGIASFLVFLLVIGGLWLYLRRRG